MKMQIKDLIKASSGHQNDAMNVINLFLYDGFPNITCAEAVSVYVLCQDWRDKLKKMADDDSDYEPLYEHFCELNRKMQAYFLAYEMLFRCHGLTLTEEFEGEEYIQAKTQFCQMAEEVSELEGASVLWKDAIQAAIGN